MSEKRNGHATGPWRVQSPLFYGGQHGACFKAPESANMKAGIYARKVWGEFVSLVPPSIKKRLGSLKDRIEGC